MFSHYNFEQLVAFAFDELDVEQAAKIAQHLENCVQCTQVVERIREWRRALGKTRLVDPSPEALRRAQDIFPIPPDEEQPAEDDKPNTNTASSRKSSPSMYFLGGLRASYIV